MQKCLVVFLYISKKRYMIIMYTILAKSFKYLFYGAGLFTLTQIIDSLMSDGEFYMSNFIYLILFGVSSITFKTLGLKSYREGIQKIEQKLKAKRKENGRMSVMDRFEEAADKRKNEKR